jgi:MFS family permease
MDRAVSYLISNYNPKGRWIGWLMMASIIVEAWDLYSIAFVLIFIRDTFHPTPALLGLAAAGTQGGAVIGALLGGWLADRLGRRIVFLSTMGMFVILALAQAFVPNLASLIIVRLILGIPLGSDISSGYTYIMESLPRGEREVMGNRWQFMFAVGQVLALTIVAIFIVADLPHDVIWRVTLGLGAVPAAIIFYLRHDLPETAIWLIRRGRFREAKQVTASMLAIAWTCFRTRTSRSLDPPRRRFLPISARIRSAGGPRCSAGSPASRRAASSPLSPFTFPCCS